MGGLESKKLVGFLVSKISRKVFDYMENSECEIERRLCFRGEEDID